MYDTLHQALGVYSVDQLALSRQAANSASLLQAARERKQERKRRRVARRSQEAYTTAV